MKRSDSLTALLAIAFAATVAPAQTAARVLNRNATVEIDGILERAVQRGTVPGVVAMVTNKDHVLYQGAFGVMDMATNKPMVKDAIFRIASMTKPVTSVAVMMLVEQGKLKLDDPVSKYLPAFKDREVISSFDTVR